MKPYLFPLGCQFGLDNLVLHASARKHVVKGFPGPLSIKSVIDGQVAWRVDERDLIVDTNSFLILNAGQEYSMNIEAPQAIETCCAFFRTGFVEQVAQDATTSVQSSLDKPTRAAPALSFVARLHHDPQHVILSRLWTLAQRCAIQLQPSGFEEDFLVLSKDLLHLYRQIKEQVSRVPASKASTREELFRRLQLAKEYLHSSTNERVSLDNVAREACLSPYHLHRSFAEVFKRTPHQYLTDLRLGRACSLLRRGHKVIDVCVEVGFNSATSFSRLFRSHFGQSPSEMRNSRSPQRNESSRSAAHKAH